MPILPRSIWPCGYQRCEVGQRAVCRSIGNLYHRGSHAGRKSLAVGYFTFLGTDFAKAFDVQFVNKDNQLEYVWATSWGVSTRLMGALIMSHSDDNGLVLPPHLAPIQVVIVPIYKSLEQLAQIDEKVSGIVKALQALGISVKYDNADNKRPGFKFADYELKGVPVRLVIGGRDLENNTVEVMRRDTLEERDSYLQQHRTICKRFARRDTKAIFIKKPTISVQNTLSR